MVLEFQFNSFQNIKNMENKKGLLLFFSLIALINGKVLYNHFDFENLSFKKPWLDTIYIIVFVFSIYGIIKNFKKKTEK